MSLATKRAVPETGTSISYLTTILIEIYQSDPLKMVHLFKRIIVTNDLTLILSAPKNGIIKWYIYVSYYVHPNIIGHTGGRITMRQGFPILALSKKKNNTRSFTNRKYLELTNLCHWSYEPGIFRILGLQIHWEHFLPRQLKCYSSGKGRKVFKQ